MTLQERLQFAFKRERDRRRDAGEEKLTKTMLWEAAKTTSAACAHWFSGDNDISLENCIKIAPLLRVNPFWLYDESEPIDKNVGICLPLRENHGDYNLNGITDIEKLILEGFRAANEHGRKYMMMIAQEALAEKEQASKRKA